MQTLADFLAVIDPLNPDYQPREPEPDVCDLTGKEFATGVLNSREYRESIVRRIRLDELPSAVECKLMDHGWGKPVETVKHEGTVEILKIERVIVYPKLEDDSIRNVTH